MNDNIIIIFCDPEKVKKLCDKLSINYDCLVSINMMTKKDTSYLLQLTDEYPLIFINFNNSRLIDCSKLQLNKSDIVLINENSDDSNFLNILQELLKEIKTPLILHHTGTPNNILRLFDNYNSIEYTEEPDTPYEQFLYIAKALSEKNEKQYKYYFDELLKYFPSNLRFEQELILEQKYKLIQRLAFSNLAELCMSNYGDYNRILELDVKTENTSRKVKHYINDFTKKNNASIFNDSDYCSSLKVFWDKLKHTHPNE